MRRLILVFVIALFGSLAFTSCESSLDEIQIEETEYESTITDDEDEEEGELG